MGQTNQRFLRTLASRVASSFLLAKGRRLFEDNSRNWNLPLSRLGKLQAGLFIILKDYSEGRFPPTFEDQSKAYQAEMDYLDNLPGVNQGEAAVGEIRKPFWNATQFARFSDHFGRLLRRLEELGLNPGARLLELGCGAGWMSEFLALSGYDVVGTSIAPQEIALAQKRVEACRVKGLPNQLKFVACPMESVDQGVGEPGAFEGVIVYEALHHAFDWRKTIQASYRCLKAGGWFLIANEPNRLHTFVSYRVARLSNTHEVGMNGRQMAGEMRRCGFRTIRVLAPRFDNWITHHWIAGQR